MVKTSMAIEDGHVCPLCRDELTVDHANMGYVRHKRDPNCDFEHGQTDPYIYPSEHEEGH